MQITSPQRTGQSVRLWAVLAFNRAICSAIGRFRAADWKLRRTLISCSTFTSRDYRVSDCHCTSACLKAHEQFKSDFMILSPQCTEVTPIEWNLLYQIHSDECLPEQQRNISCNALEMSFVNNPSSEPPFQQHELQLLFMLFQRKIDFNIIQSKDQAKEPSVVDHGRGTSGALNSMALGRGD